MSNCGHSTKVCVSCQKVISTCRCIGPKPQINSICDECKKDAIYPEVFVKRFIFAYEGNRNQLLESDIRRLYREAKKIEGVIDGK